MSQPKKYMIIRYCDGSKSIWRFIDNLEEAMSYWYVKDAIQKYGAESMMPIVMNKLGGYHTHKPDAPDVVDIIESCEWPSPKVLERYKS